MNHRPSAIVCVDLDGTSVEYDAMHAWFSEAVARQLNAAVRRRAAWCPNSGRHADNQYGMIQACRALEALPFAILAGERYIFDVHPTTGTLRQRQPYNRVAKEKARELNPRVKAVLAPHLAEIEADFAVAEYLSAAEFVGWWLGKSASPVAFADLIRTLVAPLGDAQVLRNGQWVMVLHADFGKGVALADAARELGVPRERILAVGDQHNDVDMLDGRAAALVGCPADADAEVQAVVERAGGWIADEPGPGGTAKLIQRFATEVLG